MMYRFPETSPISARALVGGIHSLCSLPEVVHKLGQLLNSPYVTNGEIGEVLINDPALTARVLKLANGELGGSSSAIETVSGAVALIGRDALRELLVATSATSRFSGIPQELIDMERFWLNSVACGCIARSLAFRCRVFDSERLFVAGLLHKVGRLVFYSVCPDGYRKVLRIADHHEDAVNRAERQVFGFGHAEVGAELLRSWGLPERLQIAVAHYLSPAEAPRFRKSAALIHVASALACNVEPSVNLDEATYDALLGFERGAWNLLGLSLRDVPTILEEAWVQAFEIFDILRCKPD